MNNKLYFVVGLVVGAVAGALGSYAATNGKFNKELEERTQSLSEQFKSELHKIAEENREGKQKLAEKFEQVTDMLQYTSNQFKPDVPVWNHPEQFTEMMNVTPPDPQPIDNGGPIHEISDADAKSEYTYRKVNLNYYSSGVLTDDDDMPIDGAYELIGKDIYDSLASRVASGLEDVYIRNEDRHVDYRISLIDDSSET